MNLLPDTGDLVTFLVYTIAICILFIFADFAARLLLFLVDRKVLKIKRLERFSVQSSNATLDSASETR